MLSVPVERACHCVVVHGPALILLIEAIDAELNRKRFILVFTTAGKHDRQFMGVKKISQIILVSNKLNQSVC